MYTDDTEEDFEPEADEELFRNPVFYEPAGRNLDLDRADLGVPEEEGLLGKFLLMRGRVPVDKRGLICPDCMRLRGMRVPMFLVNRGGEWFPSHYRKPGEKPVSHESDEHIARKELVANECVDAGHDARVEQVVAGGRARLDVSIEGADGRLLDYEPQLSEQTRRSAISRDAHRKRAGFTRIWDFVDPDHPGIGAVPYIRTPNLPAPVIRAQKRALEVRDGNFVVEEGWCTPEGTFARCPEKPYDSENPNDAYCGNHHLVVVPEHQSSAAYESDKSTLDLARFVVEVADGERVPFKVNGQHGFIRAVQYERYLSEYGAEPQPRNARPAVRDADRRSLCTEDRPAPDLRSTPRERHVSRTIVLQTRGSLGVESDEVAVDAAGQPIPLCRFDCGKPASLLGPEGIPEHFSCRKKHEEAR
ncbi:hypothetical protein [Streptomyces sp. NPDC046859]|uniref:hypothetical protein n=1 Tax=Streptomyces sp. NPDC046859 TaxID=3155734 RepID=UPI0033DAB181